MSNNKFISDVLAQFDKKVRIAKVESDIRSLNKLIQTHQAQIRELEHRIDRAKEKISKKYEYHKILYKEIEF